MCWIIHYVAVSGEAEAVGEDREGSGILLSNWQWEWREVDGAEIFGGCNYPFLVSDGGITLPRFDEWIDLILKLFLKQVLFYKSELTSNTSIKFF